MSNVLIIGASRGLGIEFVRQYREAGARVTATARSETKLSGLRALGVKALALDVGSAESVSRLAWQLDGEAFDIVVYVAGVYGPRHSGLEPPTADEFDEVMHTNVLGPMRVIPQLVDVLAPGARLMLLSSRMGAIGSRSGHSGWLYRASKAAVNSVLKDVSLALAGRATCISVHPGWVKTDMGGEGADLAPHQSVGDMRQLIDRLQPADNGSFFNHDGTPIPW